MKNLFYILSLLLLPLVLNSQKLIVGDIQIENYPYMSAEVSLIDEDGKFIEEIDKSAIKIEINGNNKPLETITCEKSTTPNFYSTIICLDISTSMAQDKRKDKAVKASKNWVDNMGSNELTAINAFSDVAYLYHNFSNNKLSLKEALDSMSLKRGTNYNSAFNQDYVGIIDLANKGVGKVNVIFVTDGLGTGESFNLEKTISRLQNKGITVYPVCVKMPVPEQLKKIAKATGGQHFRIDESDSSFTNIFELLKEYTTNKSLCKIKWEHIGCKGVENITFKIPEFNLQVTKSLQGQYQDKPQIEFIDNYMSVFECGEKSEKIVRFIARNKDVIISDTIDLNPEINDIKIDFQGREFPIVLSINDTLEVKIAYNPTETLEYLVKGVQMVTPVCGNQSIYAITNCRNNQVSKDPINITSPNGGEIFFAGSEQIVEWENSLPGYNKKAFFSTDNGVNWEYINESDLSESVNWNTPNVTSNKCLAKVVQYKTVGRPRLLNKFSSEGKDVTTSAWHPDNIKVSFGTTDGFIFTYNANTEELLFKLKVDTAEIRDLEWGSDGYHIYVSNSYKTKVINSISKQIDKEFPYTFLKKYKGKIIMDLDSKMPVELINPNTLEVDDSVYARITSEMDLNNSYGINKREFYINPISHEELLENTSFLDSVSTNGNYYDFSMNASYNTFAALKVDNQKLIPKYYLSIISAEEKEFIDEIEVEDKINDIKFNKKTNQLVTVNNNNEIEIWNIFFKNGGLVLKPEYTISVDSKNLRDIKFSNDYSRFSVSGQDENEIDKKFYIFSMLPYPSGEDISDSTFTLYQQKTRDYLIDMGDVLLNKTKDSVIVNPLELSDDLSLVIDSVRIYGNDISNFGISFNQSVPMIHNKTNDIQLLLTFNPSSIKTHTGFIRLYSKSISYLIKLTGTGIKNEINKFDYDFGTIPLGSKKTINQVILENKSDVNAKVIDVSFYNKDKTFRILEEFNNFQLKSEESKSLSIEYNATAEEINQGILTYTFDLGGKDTITKFISMVGIGKEPELIYTSLDTSLSKCQNINTYFDIYVYSNPSNLGTSELKSVELKNYAFKIQDYTYLDKINNDSLRIRISPRTKDISLLEDEIIIEFKTEGKIQIPIRLEWKESSFKITDAFPNTFVINTNYSFKDTIIIENTGEIELFWNLPLQSKNDGLIKVFDIENPLNPGQRDTVEFEFAGTEKEGIYYLDILPNLYCDQPEKIKIEVKDRFPKLSLNIEEFNVITNCYRSKKDSILIINTGDTTLLIENMRISTEGNELFDIIKNPFVIEKGESKYILIEFTPKLNGISKSAIKFNTNEFENNNYEIPLNGINSTLDLAFSKDQIIFDYYDLKPVENEVLEITNNGKQPIELNYTGKIFHNLFQIIDVEKKILFPNESCKIIFKYLGSSFDDRKYSTNFEKSCGDSLKIVFSLSKSFTPYLRFSINESMVEVGEIFNLELMIEEADYIDTMDFEKLNLYFDFNESLMIPKVGDFKLLNDVNYYVYSLTEVEEGAIIQIPTEALWGNDSCTTISLEKVEFSVKKDSISYSSDIGSLCIEELCYTNGNARLFEDTESNAAINKIAPNPANDVISIEYDIIEIGNFNLKILNNNGQILKTINNYYNKPGSYAIEINIEDLPSGIYYIQYNSLTIRDIEKLFIIR